MPFIVIPDRNYTGEITIKNNGQSIWGEKNFCLDPNNSYNIEISPICVGNLVVLPNHSQTLKFSFKISSQKLKDSYISWENVGKFAIQPIFGNPALYHPESTVKNFFYNLLWKIIPPS